MSNALPVNPSAFYALGTRIEPGLIALGGTLDIKDITAASFQAELNVFKTTDEAYSTARTTVNTATTAYAAAETTGYEWLLNARKALAMALGDKWSNQWSAAGFTNFSTAVPKKPAERLRLLGKLQAFFTANPTREVPAHEVTATKAGELLQALLQTKAAVDAANAAAKTKRDGFAVADRALRETVRMLIGILQKKLTKNDPRWQQFGLNLPSAQTTPGQPQNLTAAWNADGFLQASCDAVPLAQRYRWRVRVVGVDVAFRRAVSTKDPLAIIKDLPTGFDLELYVQAANGNAQGVASEIVFVFAAEQRAAKTAESGSAAATKAPLAVTASESIDVVPRVSFTNGNGNGHSHHEVAAVR